MQHIPSQTTVGEGLDGATEITSSSKSKSRLFQFNGSLSQFKSNLQASGFTSKLSRDGAAQIFKNGDNGFSLVIRKSNSFGSKVDVIRPRGQGARESWVFTKP